MNFNQDNLSVKENTREKLTVSITGRTLTLCLLQKIWPQTPRESALVVMLHYNANPPSVW